jgi:hypothetical protein
MTQFHNYVALQQQLLHFFWMYPAVQHLWAEVDPGYETGDDARVLLL